MAPTGSCFDTETLPVQNGTVEKRQDTACLEKQANCPIQITQLTTGGRADSGQPRLNPASALQYITEPTAGSSRSFRSCNVATWPRR